MADWLIIHDNPSDDLNKQIPCFLFSINGTYFTHFLQALHSYATGSDGGEWIDLVLMINSYFMAL